MKLGITGLTLSGKTTLFEAITRQIDPAKKGESRIGTIRVPDERIDRLSAMYNPKKTTYAQVEYFLPGTLGTGGDAKEGQYWNQVRPCDALIYVIRNFEAPGFDPPNPLNDFRKLDQELIFADLVIADKRLERH
jgi:ribosome-binding ATPase YchF (GTP1/OBG family)